MLIWKTTVFKITSIQDEILEKTFCDEPQTYQMG